MDDKYKTEFIVEYLLYRGAKDSLKKYLEQTGSFINEKQTRCLEIFDYLKKFKLFSQNNKNRFTELFKYFKQHHEDFLFDVYEKFLEIVFLEKIAINDLNGAFEISQECLKRGYILNENVYSLIGYENNDMFNEKYQDDFLEMIWDHVYFKCMEKKYPQIIDFYVKLRNTI
ncbi:hypothetical protein DMUE_5648 [Dictyocoela muelleri]|nr:hypothetical protein DMUE_5648 [Dictyocoela muelleri]